jgi:hypothetical protein
VGRQKWQPAKGLESSAQAVQKLRGILNKLTPDNFDRLLTQVFPPNPRATIRTKSFRMPNMSRWFGSSYPPGCM